MSTIEKVTAFVTRRNAASGAHELLVFRHPDAGLQLPAGSVEPGEAFADAALREVEEETGLSDLGLVAHLGTDSTELEAQRAFCTAAPILSGPTHAAGVLTTIPRGWWCTVVGEQDDFYEVCYEELNRHTEPQQVIVRFSGWVESGYLATREIRAFFHIHTTAETPDCWIQRAEDRFDFACHWLPLLPKPEIQSLQQRWIDAHHEALMTSLAHTAI